MNDFYQLSLRVLDCIERFDLNSLGELMSPDVTIWHNFDEKEKSWAQALELVEVLAKAKRVKFEDIMFAPVDRGWVQEHVVIIEDAKSVVHRIPAAMFYQVNEEGKISGIREFLDSTQLQTALTAITSERDGSSDDRVASSRAV